MYDLKKLEELTDNLKRYLILRIEILKLEASNHVSAIGSKIISSLVVAILVFMFVFTFSMGVGFYLSAVLGDTFSGFAIVAAFYFLLAVVLFAGRRKLIEKPLRNSIIKKILENK